MTQRMHVETDNEQADPRSGRSLVLVAGLALTLVGMIAALMLS